MDRSIPQDIPIDNHNKLLREMAEVGYVAFAEKDGTAIHAKKPHSQATRSQQSKPKIPDKPIKLSHEKVRAKALKHAYNMTLEAYESMFVAQFGLCAICGKVPKNGKLQVDHCHASGVIRGLLCLQCNHMLGNAQDDIKTLKNAMRYLQKHLT